MASLTNKLVVTSLANSGAGSLREALQKAQNSAGSDTITFSKNLLKHADKTIHLASVLQIQNGDDITINGDLDGDGEADITISGDTDKSGTANSGDLGTLLQVDSGAKATIESLNVADGYAKGAAGAAGAAGEDAVAGINNEGTLVIKDSIISGHLAIAGASGAYQSNPGQQSASATAGIKNSGLIFLYDSVISSSKAYGAGGVDAADGGHGGHAVAGILNDGGELHLSRLLTAQNYASGGYGGDGSTQAGNGGDGATSLLLQSGSAYGIVGYSDAPGSGGTAGGGIGVPGLGGANGHVVRLTGSYDTGLLVSDENTYNGFGTTGHDNATVGATSFFGLQGDDVIDNSAAGYGSLYGGAGHDVILTKGSGAAAYGGSGNDTIFNSSTYSAKMDGGKGQDTLDVSKDKSNFEFNMSSGIIKFLSSSATNFENFVGVNNKNFSDTVSGTGGKNKMSGKAGDDTLFGKGGNDRLDGGKGSDVLDGGKGKDTILGRGGSDLLKGVGGNDRLLGGSGIDKLSGGNGKDLIKGGTGNDEISGNKGNDNIFGNKGDDTMVGGAGRDIFHFAKKNGTNLIKDFQNGLDKLDLSGFKFKSKAAALKHFSEWGKLNDDKVQFDFKGTTIKIKGVDLKDIDASDIII